MFEQPDYDFQPSDFVWCAIGVLGAGFLAWVFL